MNLWGFAKKRRHSSAAAVILLCILFAVQAEYVSYSGRVLNQTNQAIAAARVSVHGTLLSTYTDANGEFTLEGESSGAIAAMLQPRSSPLIARYRKGTLAIDNPKTLLVSVKLFSPEGRIKTSVSSFDPLVNVRLESAFAPHGMLLALIAIGDCRYAAKIIISGNQCMALTTAGSEEVLSGLAKTTASFSLEAAAPGYRPGIFPQTQSTASNLTLTLTAQNSDTLGKFQMYYEGSGAVPDLSSGQTVQLPIAQRIHVIVFGEGYTAVDLAAGKYESDLARWYSEVFRVAPMGYFREAFIIWKYPVASSEHVVADGQADSYFKIRVVAGSVSSTLDSTAAIMWPLITTQFPYVPQQYYPSTGTTSRLAKNMTVSFMVYSTQSGRSGFSGITTSLGNPANSNQRMATAFALGQQHEFMHAMARMGDEYYDQAHTALGSSSLRQESAYISNVVCCTQCDSLPWKHLLYGVEYNKTVDSLVGAFGTNGRFHSELKCLLNGSHDNADLFGGNGNMRTDDRMCNWCRELTAFRIYERAMILNNTTTSWNTWVTTYRPAFYRVIGFSAPSPVPQQTSDGTRWFMPCQ